MDETYVKIKGAWVCFHRAVNKHGETFWTSRRFFALRQLNTATMSSLRSP
ncbi:DDE-type integrase/transposase/recombinase [Ruegeria sp. HKCCD4884]|nr:DDE-type integrase/transposase/recombinase [Ruegeria sp. HKCCD4884]NOD92406.1 DDE-type integrase/transposase/recombinase [Ruegeria sp. HKCCD4884]